MTLKQSVMTQYYTSPECVVINVDAGTILTGSNTTPSVIEEETDW